MRVMKPSPGDLTAVEAGFSTGLGTFAAGYVSKGRGWEYSFKAPKGTNGILSVETPDCDRLPTIVGDGGSRKVVAVSAKSSANDDRTEVDGLVRGSWKATFARSRSSIDHPDLQLILNE